MKSSHTAIKHLKQNREMLLMTLPAVVKTLIFSLSLIHI